MQLYKRAYTNLTARSVTGLLHQLDSTFRSRLDSTPERFRVSDGTSCVRSAFSYHHAKPIVLGERTERQRNRTQLWAFGDSRLRPRQGQCRTRTAHRRLRGMPSGGRGACRGRSWGFMSTAIYNRGGCGQDPLPPSGAKNPIFGIKH